MRAPLTPTTWIDYDQHGSGTPIVLLHAFPLDRAMWRPQIDLQNSCQLILPDFRGFGGSSPWNGPPSVEQMADDVAGLLDAVGVRGPVVLGGLSMGGYVALAFAGKYPTRLRALILADTRAEPDTDEAKANRDKMIAFARTHSAAEVIDQMLPKLLGAETQALRPGVKEQVRQIATRQSAEGIIGALQALRDRPDARPFLSTIRVPTLVLVGSEDVLTPPSAAQTLATGIAGAQLVTIPGAGHLANLEQPEAINAALRSFVQFRLA